MAIIGYSISAQDNDSFYLEDEKHLDAESCIKCGFLLDPVNYFNPFFKIKKKNLDFSYTHDLRPIVSLRFKEFCIREGCTGIDFKEFEREPNFFHFKVKEVIEIDVSEGLFDFVKLCNICGNWEGVYTNCKPLKLSKEYSELKDGFYRTDILFSYGNRKNPIFIIGIETFYKLKREKIKGLIIDPIYGEA
jgi:hypothetical protein